MADNIFTGNAIAVAQVWKVTPAGVEIGDVFTLTINGKSISFTATAATVANVTAGLVAAWNASLIAEFAEVTASDAGTHLLLTADTAGKPFIVSSSTTNTTAGAITIVETTKGVETVNEVQRLKLQTGVSGGTFTYTNDFGFGNETTAAIAWNDSAAALKAAIVALATPVDADLSVVKAADGDWYITWTGAFAAVEVAEGTIDGALLTGTGNVTVETTTQGGGPSDEIQQIKISQTGTNTAWSYTLTFGGQATATITQADNTAAIQTKLEALSSIGAGNCKVYGTHQNNTNTGTCNLFVKFTGALAGLNVGLISGTAISDLDITIVTIVAGGQSAADEVQHVDIGQPTAGTYRLRVAGETTESITLTSSQATIESLLEALSTVDVVSVYGDAYSHLIVYQGTAANSDQDLAAIVSSLTSGTPVVSEVRRGGGNLNEVQKIRVFASGGSFTLSDGTSTTSAIAFGALAATIKTRLETDIAAITTVTVTGTGTPTDPYVVTYTNPGNTDVPELTGNGALLTGSDGIVTEEVAHNAGANEVQTITIDAGVTAGTFTVTDSTGDTTGNLAFSITSAALQTALEALVGIGAGNVAVAGDGPHVITYQGALAKLDVPLLTVDGSNLVGGSGTQTLVITETTRSRGPNHWNDPLNWHLGHVLEHGETPVLQSGKVDVLYGLNQWAVFTADNTTENLTIANHDFVDEQKVQVQTDGGTLPTGLAALTDYYVIYVDKDTIQLSATRGGAAINITTNGSGTNIVGVFIDDLDHYARTSMKIGLPIRNATGDYREYRPLKLKLLMLAASTNKRVRIGEGIGQSGSRLNFDFRKSQVNWKIYQTGTGADSVPACLIENQNAASTLELIEGEAGIAFERGETCEMDKITQRAGTLVLGKGHVNADIEKTGGELRSHGATINGILTGNF